MIGNMLNATHVAHSFEVGQYVINTLGSQELTARVVRLLDNGYLLVREVRKDRRKPAQWQADPSKCRASEA